jgi:hypothetical protein
VISGDGRRREAPGPNSEAIVVILPGKGGGLLEFEMDRAAKALLAVIAIGLWANIAIVLLRPAPAGAQSDELSGIATDRGKIENGTCTNVKLC